jgi:hypothetical protein
LASTAHSAPASATTSASASAKTEQIALSRPQQLSRLDERSIFVPFYPTVLIVIASYYVLFAVMAASRRTLLIEIVVASGFLLFAVLGFKRNLWLVAAALVGHGFFDFVHRMFIQNSGVPPWWPGFCLAFDALLGVFLAVRLIRHPERVSFDGR